MSWSTQAAKHVNTPVLLMSIIFNSGTRRYSNEYVRATAECYKGKILQWPQIGTSIGDIKRTYEKDQVSVIFDDSDYEFRGLEQTESVGFRNVAVTIEAAFQDDAYATKETIYEGRICGWKRLDGLRFQFDIESAAPGLTNEYPDRWVTLTDYANADPTAVGCTIPIPFGTVSANGVTNDGAYGHPALSGSGQSGLPLVDTRTDQKITLVGMQSAAITVDRVYIDGVLQTAAVNYNIGTQVIDSRTYTEIRWVAGTNPTAANKISCDIQFQPTFTPSRAIYEFLTDIVGWTEIILPVAYSVPVEASRGYLFDGVLWERKTLQTILDEWRAEWEMELYWLTNGNAYMSYLTTSYYVYAYKWNDLLHILPGLESTPNPDKIMNKLRYGYNFHYSKAYFYNYGTYQDTASQTKYGGTFENFQGFYFVRNATTAGDLAARKIIRQKDPLVFDKMVFPFKAFYDTWLAGAIKITHFSGSGTAGYVDKAFQVRAINLDPDSLTATEILEDVSNFIGKAFILGDGDLLPTDWDDAVSGDRDYGYLCDDTDDYFDNDVDPGKRLFD